ncbi:SPOR domain-containing protein [Rhodohalobacter sp.]|uniref:SPOR domain-containing protein n=1 Tax=Rhodohalobacter sp. TaxID=1974210 RepID=UPI0035652D45
MTSTEMRRSLGVFIMLLLFAADGFAQNSNDYRRVSLSLYGGATLGYPDDVNQIFGSNYNTFTETTYNFGGGIQYAISPFWSAELGYRYNTIKGVGEEGFETVIHSASIKNTFNFNRLYRRNQISEWLNPYLIVGFEQDFFNYKLDDEEVSGNESAILGGLGVAFSITNSVDVFSQFEVKMASNGLDNERRGFPFDQVGMATGGIRINFGRGDAKPLNLSPAVKRLTDDEYDNFIQSTEEFKAASQEIEAQRAKLTEIEEQFNESEKNSQEKIERLEEFTRLLEARIDTLEYRLDNLEVSVEESAQERDQVLKSEVPAGHYVQVFAATSYEAANRVKEIFHELLGNEFENPEEIVFVIERGRFYEVLVGTFAQFEDAQRAHEIALNRLSDAFIITFPRPLHLVDEYRGTAIVHD